MACEVSREPRWFGEQELEVAVAVAERTAVESNGVDASCWDPEQRPGMVVAGIHPGVEDEADMLVGAVGAAAEEGMPVAEDTVGRVDGMLEEYARVVLS